MKDVNYLETPIAAKRIVEAPRYGLTVGGYTTRAGAPTPYMIRLEGENRWRRVMCWQFSNVGTCFVVIKLVPFIIRDGTLENVPLPGEGVEA